MHAIALERRSEARSRARERRYVLLRLLLLIACVALIALVIEWLADIVVPAPKFEFDPNAAIGVAESCSEFSSPSPGMVPGGRENIGVLQPQST